MRRVWGDASIEMNFWRLGRRVVGLDDAFIAVALQAYTCLLPFVSVIFESQFYCDIYGSGVLKFFLINFFHGRKNYFSK